MEQQAQYKDGRKEKREKRSKNKKFRKKVA